MVDLQDSLLAYLLMALDLQEDLQAGLLVAVALPALLLASPLLHQEL